jgi:hypothetical protein
VAGGGIVPDATSGKRQERKSTPKGVPEALAPCLPPPREPFCDPSGVGLLFPCTPEVGQTPDAPATFWHAFRHALGFGHFSGVAERRDDGSQGLQPLDPVRVSGASRRDAGIDCLRFLMNPLIRLDLP